MDQPTDRSLPDVAVVVIGRNEGERLRRCLASVLQVNYPRELLQVIYVDSHSTDDSLQLAQGMGIRTVALDGPTTPARGRNAGWRAAEASFILFLDGDTIVDPEFLRRALPEMTDPKVAGVCGDRREMSADDSVYNAVFDLDWRACYGTVDYFGGDALVRMEALRAVDGYTESLIAGEEPEMCWRMRHRGYSILQIQAPMTQHDLAMRSFRQYWWRSVRTGWAYANVSSLYAATDDPLWLRESQHIIAHAAFWSGLILCAIAVSIWKGSLLACLLALLVVIAQCLRPALRVRARAKLLWHAIAYGVHSEFQHFPILWGHMRYWKHKRWKQPATIIDYKSQL